MRERPAGSPRDSYAVVVGDLGLDAALRLLRRQTAPLLGELGRRAAYMGRAERRRLKRKRAIVRRRKQAKKAEQREAALVARRDPLKRSRVPTWPTEAP